MATERHIGWRRSVSLEALAVFYRRMATVVAAGISLDQALAFGAATDSVHLQRAVEHMTRMVQTGHPLSRAMAAYRDVFSPVAVGLIQAAEQSGSIDRALRKLADLTEQNVRLKKMVLAALTYPAALTFTILGLGAFVVLVIRKVIDSGVPTNPAGDPELTAETLLGDVSGYLTRPDGYDLGAIGGEPGLESVEIVAVKLLWFQPQLGPEPQWPGELVIDLRAVAILDAQKHRSVGQDSLATGRFTVQLLESRFLRN